MSNHSNADSFSLLRVIVLTAIMSVVPACSKSIGNPAQVPHDTQAARNQTATIEPLAPTDWPQIRGRDGAGIATGFNVTAWGESGLERVWSADVGAGFSSPIVFGKHVFLIHRPNQREAVLIAELRLAETGKIIWTQKIACQYGNGEMDSDPGPKATPVMANGRLFVFGPAGNLTCLDAANGEIIWQANVAKLYGTNNGYFGVGSSPIVVDDKVIVNVGGRQSAVVALDTETGEEVWKSFDDRASYSSPIATRIGNTTALIVVTRLHVLGLDAADGRVVFQQKFGRSGPTAIGAMPVLAGENVFINGAYGVGGRCLALASTGKQFGDDGYQPTEVWSNDNVFASQYSTPVYHDGYFYGTSGREDFRNGSMRCFAADTGKLKWEHKNSAVGHCILVGDNILYLDHVGMLRLLAASPEGYKELARFKISTAGTRAIPAVANGLLFTKTNGVKAKLECWKLP